MGEIKHIVLVKFKEGTSQLQMDDMVKRFANLANLIEPMKSFRWGRDVSTTNMHQGFTYAFESIFETMDNVETYSAPLAHLQFADHAMTLTDAILVLDYKPTTDLRIEVVARVSEQELRVVNFMGLASIVDKRWALFDEKPSSAEDERSVGTTMGDIGIWQVGSWEKLVLNNSKVNYLNAVSISQQKKQGRDVSTANMHQGFTYVSESIFETMDDVETYSAHPTHLQFADHALTLTDAILVLDYKPTLDLRIKVVVGVSEQELRVVNFMGLASTVDKRWALFDVAANDLDTFFA
ncbi:stress-response A/B barrel domain-containing protein HS1 [Tanacetum coccineum]|uniref:Stress-response A/B barrel domain-containing protein HS1 n=1 Tax=Tanacetum coccineum TaxID=301880 RepID=A0ABQ5EME6_9ASTR